MFAATIEPPIATGTPSTNGTIARPHRSARPRIPVTTCSQNAVPSVEMSLWTSHPMTRHINGTGNHTVISPGTPATANAATSTMGITGSNSGGTEYLGSRTQYTTLRAATAPVCVAKGVDEVAARIRARAAEAGIPLHHDPPTARALHATVRLGQPIRPEHYRAVAAAIRFAEGIRRKRRG